MGSHYTLKNFPFAIIMLFTDETRSIVIIFCQESDSAISFSVYTKKSLGLEYRKIESTTPPVIQYNSQK